MDEHPSVHQVFKLRKHGRESSLETLGKSSLKKVVKSSIFTVLFEIELFLSASRP